MNATHAQTPAELVFPPQVPFSWTRRWARAHRSEAARTERRAIRIAGSTPSSEDVSAAIAFARAHDARLELD